MMEMVRHEIYMRGSVSFPLEQPTVAAEVNLPPWTRNEERASMQVRRYKSTEEAEETGILKGH